jgi:hypothetical protein
LALIVAIDNKNRKDQVICGQSRFSHQAAAKIISTHAAHAANWEFAAEIEV